MDTVGELVRPELSPRTRQFRETVEIPGLPGKKLEISTSQERLANYFGQFASKYAHLPEEEVRDFFKRKVKFGFGSVASISGDNLFRKMAIKLQSFRANDAWGGVLSSFGKNIVLTINAKKIAEFSSESSPEQKIEDFKRFINKTTDHELVHCMQIKRTSYIRSLSKGAAIMIPIALVSTGINRLVPALFPTTPNSILTCIDVIGYAAGPFYAACSVVWDIKKGEREAYGSEDFSAKTGLTPFQFKLITSRGDSPKS